MYTQIQLVGIIQVEAGAKNELNGFCYLTQKFFITRTFFPYPDSTYKYTIRSAVAVASSFRAYGHRSLKNVIFKLPFQIKTMITL